MQPWGLFQVNEATDVFFMILCGCFICEIALNLSFRCVEKSFAKSGSIYTLACEQALHLRVRKCLPIKTLNEKFSLLKKFCLSNETPQTMIFLLVKFHLSRCWLAVANFGTIITTAMLMKSFYTHTITGKVLHRAPAIGLRPKLFSSSYQWQ